MILSVYKRVVQPTKNLSIRRILPILLEKLINVMDIKLWHHQL